MILYVINNTLYHLYIPWSINHVLLGFDDFFFGKIHWLKSYCRIINNVQIDVQIGWVWFIERWLVLGVQIGDPYMHLQRNPL